MGDTVFSATSLVNRGALFAKAHLRSASTFSRDLSFDFMTSKLENPASHKYVDGKSNRERRGSSATCV